MFFSKDHLYMIDTEFEIKKKDYSNIFKIVIETGQN